MEYKNPGNAVLTVQVLSFVTAALGGGNEFFKAWGNKVVDEAPGWQTFAWTPV